MVAEKFIKTLKSRIYKHLNAVSKIVYIDKLDKISDKSNKNYPKAIKIKSANVQLSIILTTVFNTINDKDPNLKVGDHVSIKTKKIFFQKATHTKLV